MKNLLEQLRPHAKAIVAFLTPAVAQLVLDLKGGVTLGEAGRSAAVALLTAVLVWLKSNAPA